MAESKQIVPPPARKTRADISVMFPKVTDGLTQDKIVDALFASDCEIKDLDNCLNDAEREIQKTVLHWLNVTLNSLASQILKRGYNAISLDVGILAALKKAASEREAGLKIIQAVEHGEKALPKIIIAS